MRAALLAVALVVAVCGARADDDSDDVDAALDAARQQIDAAQRQLADRPSASQLAELRRQSLDVHKKTTDVAASLAPKIASVEARLAQLGAPPAAPAVEEADVAAQRSRLQASRRELDAQIRLAKLLAIEGDQAADQIGSTQRERFAEQLFERTPSVLAPLFWQELRESWPHDVERLARLGGEARAAAQAAPRWAWGLVAATVAAAVALAWWLSRLLLRIVTTRLPHGRLRRSLIAVGFTTLPTAATWLAGEALAAGFDAGNAATAGVDALLAAFVAATTFGAFVISLLDSVTAPRRPSWRLPALPDAMVEKIRRQPLWLGLAVAGDWLLERVAALINTGLSSAVAINCLASIALGWLFAHTVRRNEQLRKETAAANPTAAVADRPIWEVLLIVLSVAVIVAGLVCLLLGYVALGTFMVRQVAWFVIVGTVFYLLAIFVDDVCMTLLGAEPADDSATASTKPPALRLQVGVLASAALRVVLAVVAVAAALAPFGQGPGQLMDRAGSFAAGFTIGEIHVQPTAVLRGLAIFALGVIAVRVLQRWLLDRYLPTTTVELGMRMSVVTLLGYAGFVVAVAFALSGMGLGLERVAWVASALSVGIGFGLQAVVQNFVSGLILLTERPVKVGDWVSLGDVEGDIRRINVRATEIQMDDRSTVIVPNSEFITKTVRNVTHANPLGLVLIKLPLPIASDPERVRELILDAFAAHQDVLDKPAPSVALDGIDAGSLVFKATGSVASPRQVASVRSALLFDVLARFKAAGLALSRPPTVMVREPDAST